MSFIHVLVIFDTIFFYFNNNTINNNNSIVTRNLDDLLKS